MDHNVEIIHSAARIFELKKNDWVHIYMTTGLNITSNVPQIVITI